MQAWFSPMAMTALGNTGVLMAKDDLCQGALQDTTEEETVRKGTWWAATEAEACASMRLRRELRR